MTFTRLSLGLAVALPFAQVEAAPLTIGQVLNQFNLVVLGDSTSGSHVDGRTFIGGNVTGGDYAQQGTPPVPVSAYAGLTVLGNANQINQANPSIQVNNLGITVLGAFEDGNVNNGPGVVVGNASNVNFNGPSYVGGTKTGVNQNGGLLSQAAANAAIANATSTNFAQVATLASDALSTLTGNSFVSISGNKATFTATPVGGIAVFNITANDTTIFSKGEFEFVGFGNADLIIINSDDNSITTGANFLGGSATAIATKTLWNFYNATSLNLNAQFGGAILATSAHLTNSNNIEGSVVVNSLTQNGELHLQSFGPGNTLTGLGAPVPVPAAALLFAPALAALGFTGRQRKGAVLA